MRSGPPNGGAAVAIVPAAGRSSRMGRPKLLLPLGGETILGRVVDSLRGAGIRRIVIVVAPDQPDLHAWAEHHGLELAINPDPDDGMLSTILCGVRHAVRGRTDKVGEGPLLVTPADLPGLRSDSVGSVLAAYPASQPLIQPTWQRRRGHPLLIAPQLVPELFELDPAVGLKQIRERHPVLEIPVDDPGVVRDVDTPHDYERFRGRVE